LLNGYIIKNIENYGLLSVSDAGRDYMKAPSPVQMSIDRVFDKVSEDDADIAQIESICDEVLFRMLKDLTKKVAKQKNLPPYVIFQEPTLEDMATKYPITLEELEHIGGIGKNKAQKFGKPFIELIEKYVDENNIERPDDLVVRTVPNRSGKKIAIIQNIDKKIGLDVISRSNGITYDELLTEIENIVYSGTKLNIKYYINDFLDEERQQEVYDFFRTLEIDSIDTAFNEFEGEYSHEELRLLRIQFFSDMAN
jgi:ATP-dependent DNA helicase RecQ